jgi:outer membrane protein OmpA-like peptidoglycan-associated protein
MTCSKSYLSYITATGLVLLCLLSTVANAQKTENESGGTECGQSKVIILPFVTDTGRVKNPSKHVIYQYNQYEQVDQFSYWYKLNIEADMVITCQITPVNKMDKYMIYIYKYRDDDFCEKVFKNKIKPARVENEENKKSIIEASESSDFEFEAHAGDRFYFSILTISRNNCGHNLMLITGGDTLKVVTAHAPCVGLVKESTVEAPVKLAEIKQTADTIAGNKQLIKKLDTVSVVVSEINKKDSRLTSKIKAIDITSGKSMKVIYSKDNSSIRLVYEKGKKYTIECTSTGYKTFNHQMVVSEYVNPNNNSFLVFMKPLKSGDNFVMENIYFFPNTYALKDQSKDALSGLLNYMLNHPEVKIELQGHTNGNNKFKQNKNFKDEGPEWNFSGTAKKLSVLRAEEIKKYLVDNGVNADNITTVGFGGEKMIIANPKSPEAIKKNARVEVVIINDGGL